MKRLLLGVSLLASVVYAEAGSFSSGGSRGFSSSGRSFSSSSRSYSAPRTVAPSRSYSAPRTVAPLHDLYEDATGNIWELKF